MCSSVLFAQNNDPTEEFKKVINSEQAFDIGDIKKLIDAGADVNVRNEKGYTPLHMAISNNQIEIVKLLLDGNADVDLTDSTHGGTPLLLVSGYGYTEIVKLLLGANANVDLALNTDGATPLIISSWKGHTEIVKLLLDANADVTTSNKKGFTPLCVSSDQGHTEIVKLLLDANADVNVSSQNGITPLLLASQNGHTEIVKLLIEAKSDINAIASMGGKEYNSLDLAKMNHHHEIIELLEEAINILNNSSDVHNEWEIQAILYDFNIDSKINPFNKLDYDEGYEYSANGDVQFHMNSWPAIKKEFPANPIAVLMELTNITNKERIFTFPSISEVIIRTENQINKAKFFLAKFPVKHFTNELTGKLQVKLLPNNKLKLLYIFESFEGIGNIEISNIGSARIKDIITEEATPSEKESIESWLKFPPSGLYAFSQLENFELSSTFRKDSIKDTKALESANRLVCDKIFFVNHPKGDFNYWAALMHIEESFSGNEIPRIRVHRDITITPAELILKYGEPSRLVSFETKNDIAWETYWFGPICVITKDRNSPISEVAGWPSELTQ